MGLQDVYTQVADRVKANCLIVADTPGHQHQRLAKLLASTVDRKLVKQTVMTSVYGVTNIGAKEQIERRLIERDFKGDSNNDSFKVAQFAAAVRTP